ncbi:hypothetical protein [Streptomyces coeruleorubidus]
MRTARCSAGACRGPAPLGDRAAEAVADTSRRLAAELVVRDEVDHRLRLLDAAQGRADGGQRGVSLEELRQVHAELRRIARCPTVPCAVSCSTWPGG